MKKIFYLFILGILFLIPKNVFAKEILVTWPTSGTPGWVWTQNDTNMSIAYVYDSNNYYGIQAQSSGFDTFYKYQLYMGKADYEFNSSYTYDISFIVGVSTSQTNDTTYDKWPVTNVILYTSIDKFSTTTQYSCDVKRRDKNSDYYYYYDVSCKDVVLDTSTLLDFNVDLKYGVYWAYVSKSWNFIENSNSALIGDMINEQEKTNEKLDGINDTINNSDIDTDGANSFFGDFSDTDHGGISGVVTAPLRFINKLTGTCSPISLDVLGANVELPCGDTLFWNKPEVANFRIIWNLLVGGPILYLLLSKLFKVIESLKNPDDSRIEVMKL